MFHRNDDFRGGSTPEMSNGAVGSAAASAGMFAYHHDRHNSRGSGMTLNGSMNSQHTRPVSPLQEDDQRIDLGLAEAMERTSSDSLQDGQDYSRKILKVTNPDSSGRPVY